MEALIDCIVWENNFSSYLNETLAHKVIIKNAEIDISFQFLGIALENDILAKTDPWCNCSNILLGKHLFS